MHFSKDAFQPSTSTEKNLLKRDAIPSNSYTEFEDVIDENVSEIIIFYIIYI